MANQNQQEVKQDEFPALHGEEEVEVAKRSQDVEAEATDTHEKVFVLLKRDYEPNPDKEDLHNRNIAATRQYMIHQGLRPEEDGSFVGEEDNEDGESVNLTYAVRAVPAVVATDPEVSHAEAIPGDADTTEEMKDN